mmetsp:Transcript_16798/g.45073  ORF Transcript_16798/g.45073 Transcript_16798/m.45073 type:complete len:250 (+) Transcript_16798:1585-2334(+)
MARVHEPTNHLPRIRSQRAFKRNEARKRQILFRVLPRQLLEFRQRRRLWQFFKRQRKHSHALPRQPARGIIVPCRDVTVLDQGLDDLRGPLDENARGALRAADLEDLRNDAHTLQRGGEAVSVHDAEPRAGESHVLGHGRLVLGVLPVDVHQRLQLQRVPNDLAVQMHQGMAPREDIRGIQRAFVHRHEREAVLALLRGLRAAVFRRRQGHAGGADAVRGEGAGLVEAAHVDFARERDAEGLGAKHGVF